MDPQTELTRRYPSRDFSSVFAFLASVPLLAEGTAGTNRHHICPCKQFPEYEFGYPENIVILSVSDHVYVHLLLELCEPKLKSPATMLFELQHFGSCKGGKAAAETNKQNGTGFYDLEVQRMGSRAQPREAKVQGGRKGGSKTASLGTLQAASALVRARPGHQAKAARAGGYAQPREAKFRGGQSNVENKTGFCKPGAAEKGGRIQGRNNAKNHTGFCGRSKEQMTADGRKAGLVSAHKHGSHIIDAKAACPLCLQKEQGQ